MRLRPIVTIAWALLLIVASRPAAQVPPPAHEQIVFVNDQQSVTPGYLVGNIAIGDPKVADFKVMPGRKEILVFGKAAGSTRLTVWDQKNVKRDDIIINVTTRQAQELEKELRDLLKDFPSVEVRAFAGSLAVAGAVSSKDDLAAIEKIAAAAKARNLVRYVAPVGPESPAGGPPASSTTPSGPESSARPAVPTLTSEIEYEIELLEASSKFRSGSYATGVEPSGRSLYKGMVRAPIGAEREVFIGGNAVTTAVAKDGSSKGASSQSTQTGIKLTLKPVATDGRGKFKTAMLIETNLPFSGETYDPAVWRRARWEFSAGSGEPFGITGADLLATPDASSPKGSAMGSTTRTASKIVGIPGVSAAPGANYVPVFGSLFGSRSYQQKATQLLVILRPRVVAPRP